MSVVARLAWTYLAPNGANFVDLHVYVGGVGDARPPRQRSTDYVYADQTPDFPLPFTYPPFAAVLFYPLHFLPFGAGGVLLDSSGSMAALYGVRRGSASDCSGVAAGEGHRLAMLVDGDRRSGSNRCAARFDYGQINVVAGAGRAWARSTALGGGCPGCWSGSAAGVKLTPAVGGSVFPGARRVGRGGVLGGCVRRPPSRCRRSCVGDQTRYYFTDLIWRRRDRVGPGRHDRSISRGAARSARILRPRRGLRTRWC